MAWSRKTGTINLSNLGQILFDFHSGISFEDLAEIWIVGARTWSLEVLLIHSIRTWELARLRPWFGLSITWVILTRI